MAKPNNENKAAILIYNNKGNLIKFFKVWSCTGDGTKAKIEITYKKNGEKKKIVKEYIGYSYTIEGTLRHKVAITCCVNAVIKYWPKYDPQEHLMINSSGHYHKVVKPKKKKGNKK